jgi:hypothetical protein
MRYRFFLDGQSYSRNKNSFKKMLRKHEMSFKHSYGDFVWENDREKVIAEFERDLERDVTISATIIWEGHKKTEFMEELKAWVWELGGKGDKDEAPAPRASEVESRIDEELRFWDGINKPDIGHLKATGRPDEWIKRDVEDWRNRRREKKRELAEKYRV